MKRTAYLFLLLILFSQVSAQRVEPWTATRELRKKEAGRLNTLLIAMDLQVPELSPAEKQWLDGELSSGNRKITQKYINTTDSQEYAIDTVKSDFELIIGDLNVLNTPPLACKYEVMLWADVASKLPDPALWQSVDHLVERKIISKQSVKDFGNSFPAANATLRSQAILNGVVVPYLKGTLNCEGR